jgi:hypothetical protein
LYSAAMAQVVGRGRGGICSVCGGAEVV